MKILFIISIIIQTLAMFVAIRLVRATKYNSIWILLIFGFMLLSAERYMQLSMYNGVDVSQKAFYFTGIVVSILFSIGVMYAHKLFLYIDKLILQRSLTAKRILSAVLRTEEKSRARYSAELHDGLGPLLSAAKMSISAIEHAKSNEEREEIIANANVMIDEAIRSLREISNNLSPHVLSDFGVARAISSFINKSLTLHQTKIKFETNIYGERYNDDMEVVIYRVACELINNSLKHSQCKNISLSLMLLMGQIVLEYNDDGCGFDYSEMNDKGMGLSNIASRINSLNGTLIIERGLERGMVASIRVNVDGTQVEEYGED